MPVREVGVEIRISPEEVLLVVPERREVVLVRHRLAPGHSFQVPDAGEGGDYHPVPGPPDPKPKFHVAAAQKEPFVPSPDALEYVPPYRHARAGYRGQVPIPHG